MLAFKCYTKFNYSYWRIWEKQKTNVYLNISIWLLNSINQYVVK